MLLTVIRMEQRLAAENGTLHGVGRRQVALVYPNTYSVGMASLGYQTVYRLLNSIDDTVAERAFLPEPGAAMTTLESGRSVGDFAVVAFSVGYELDAAAALSCLENAGIPLWASERTSSDPWVVAGGPLTYSNPAPIAAMCDVVLMGEAEDLLESLIDLLWQPNPRAATLEKIAQLPGFYVPSIHDGPSEPVQCSDAHLPAHGAIWTHGSALGDMFLVEAERGCSRGCSFCVMHKGSGRGMRVVAKERILAAIPESAPRVGLVGAAVSDHPQIAEILEALVADHRQVGLSSLRADRLNDDLVRLLIRGGVRTLTIAADGASERLRQNLNKHIRRDHLLAASRYAALHNMPQLKLYAMIGVPTETDADLEELIELVLEMSKIAPLTRMSLALSPFVPKLKTPLADLAFVGVQEAERRVRKLRRALEPRVSLKPVSPRWAWVEYALSQSRFDVGQKINEARNLGGGFAAYRRALKGVVPF